MSIYLYHGAQSLSGPLPNRLRLIYYITMIPPKLATSDTATPYRAGFKAAAANTTLPEEPDYKRIEDLMIEIYSNALLNYNLISP